MSITYYMGFASTAGLVGGSENNAFKGWFELENFSFSSENYGSNPLESTFGVGELSQVSVTFDTGTEFSDFLSILAKGSQPEKLQIVGVESVDGKGATTFKLGFDEILFNGLSDNSASEESLSFSVGQASFTDISGKSSDEPGTTETFGFNYIDNKTVAGEVGSGIGMPNATHTAVTPTQYYISIDGINGDVDIDGGNFLSLEGFSFASSASGTPETGGSKASFSEISLNFSDQTALVEMLSAAQANTAFSGARLIGTTTLPGESEESIVYEVDLAGFQAGSVNLAQSAGIVSGFGATFEYETKAAASITTEVFGLNETTGALESIGASGWNISQNISEVNHVTPVNSSTETEDGATNFYMYIDTLVGGAQDANHEGWFDVSGYSFGQLGQQFNSVFVNAEFGHDLAEILQNLSEGTAFDNLVIEGENAAGDVVSQLVLNDVNVTSISGTNSNADSVAFDFGQVGMQTTAYSKAGSPSGTTEFAHDTTSQNGITFGSLNDATSTEAPDFTPQVSQYYLVIDGVSGTSTDKGFEGWFEIDDANFGALSESGNFGMNSLAISGDFNTGSANILDALADNAIISSAHVVGVGNVGGKSGQTVYELALGDVVLENFSTGSNGSDFLSLDFTQFASRQAEVSLTGKVGTPHEFGFDLETNKAIDYNDISASKVVSAVDSAVTTQYVLQIDGFSGNSEFSGYEGWFDLDNFSFGAFDNTDPSESGSGGSFPIFGDIGVVAQLGGSITDLFAAATSGDVLNAATIVGLDVSGVLPERTYELRLEDVGVNGVSAAGNGTSTSFSLEYNQIGLQTTGIDMNDNTSVVGDFGYDTSKNAEIAFSSVDTASSTESFLSAKTADKFFIKIDGIDGDSDAPGYEGWFDLSNFDFGAVQPQGGSEIALSGLGLVLPQGQALIHLLEINTLGTVFNATIEGVASGGTPAEDDVAFTVRLKDAFVDRVADSGSTGEDQGAFIATLQTSQIGLFWSMFDSNGEYNSDAEFGYDQTTGLAIDPKILLPEFIGPLSDVNTSQNVVTENAAAFSNTGVSLSAAAAVDYTLTSNPGDLFGVYSNGVVFVKNQIDYEVVGNSVTLTAQAENEAGITTDFTFDIAINNVFGQNVFGDEFDNVLLAPATAEEDSYFGEGGEDTVSYASQTSYVGADLLNPASNKGEARGDEYDSIENLIGGSADDNLSGDNGDNVLEGGDGSDFLNGRDGDDRLIYSDAINTSFRDSLNGGDGNDVADYSQFGAAIWVDLSRTATAAWTQDVSTVFAPGGVWRVIADHTSIENVIGTDFDDYLYGNAGDNIFGYTEGRDRISGGDGTDTVVYGNFHSAVWVDLNWSAWTQDASGVFVSGGVWRQISDLTSIENVVGSGFDDSLSGSDGDNIFAYVGGRDSVNGRDGSDTADYSGFDSAVWVDLSRSATNAWTQNDTAVYVSGGTWEVIGDFNSIENVTGSDFDDYLIGDDGDNIFGYTEGFDYFAGAAGSDTVDYSQFDSAVWVNLSLGSSNAWTQDAEAVFVSGGVWRATGDYNSIENVTGSAFDDYLTGSDGDNVFGYTGGDDYFSGGNGEDTADYSRFDSAIWVNLELGASNAWTQDAESVFVSGGVWRVISDFNSIENVIGTNFNDEFYGDENANTFTTLEGFDYVNGREGLDTVDYSYGLSTDFTINEFSDTNWTVTNNATGDIDTLYNIETLHFSDVDVLA